MVISSVAILGVCHDDDDGDDDDDKLMCRLQRWSFFETMGWSFFFSKAPLPSMVFQWFYQPWTITIECFFTDQPLISMVFRWFSQIQVRWSAMVSTLKET